MVSEIGMYRYHFGDRYRYHFFLGIDTDTDINFFVKADTDTDTRKISNTDTDTSRYSDTLEILMITITVYA